MQVLNHSNSNITSTSVGNQVSTALLSLCFLIGIPGNIVIVVVIFRHFKKDNYTLHLMLNLAVSDILCLISLPVWIYYLNIDWIFSQALCKFIFFLVFTSKYSGVLTVTVMSVQRYLVVLHRNWWAKLGSKREKVLLLSLWTLACILSSPAAATAHVREEGQRHHCWRFSAPNQETLAILLCETLLGFVLPFSIIVSSYYCLHKKVNQTAFFNNPRLTKLVTTIVLTFVILWLPGHVVNLMKILAIALKSVSPSVSAQLYSFSNLSTAITYSFTCLNSCVNPFLYGACTFRQLAKEKRTATSTQNSGG
ncbi:C-C chemokine receptor type 1-like [Alosa sapidissima]|uniref:C-C chemokine receptor type 1-like n=1 Tax=Alosa sapidissima TaxID=34773 RepID=UPI001C096D90|nr:C-C chemokine receptor type 1-like [Alosa sapidissima]